MTLVSAFVLLFLVMDPFGNIPMFAATLAPVPPERRRRVLVRELGIALGLLVLFLFAGPAVLRTLGISEPSLSIAGGIILFLIALRMIFPSHGTLAEDVEGEPFIVPLAIPLIAGPSAMAMMIVMSRSDPGAMGKWTLALLLAWVGSAVVLLSAPLLMRVLRTRGLAAMERLMGMILIMLAVEMFIEGFLRLG